MGYEFHITRKDYWANPKGPRIAFEEWLRYVESDAEIIKDPVNGEHDFLFVRGGFSWSLWWHDKLGEIYTKNPDEQTIQKMVEIARKLGARVLGDDDEEYPRPAPEVAAIRKSFWRRLFGG